MSKAMMILMGRMSLMESSGEIAEKMIQPLDIFETTSVVMQA